MATYEELQMVIFLSLIPCVIAAMYALTQVSEAIRNRGQEQMRRTAREDVGVRRVLNRRR